MNRLTQQNPHGPCKLCQSAWKADTFAMLAPLLMVLAMISSILFIHPALPWKTTRQTLLLPPAVKSELEQSLRACAFADPMCKAVLFDRYLQASRVR